MLKKMRLKKKLIIAFLVVTLTATFSGIAGVLCIEYLNSRYAFAMTNYGYTLGDLGLGAVAFTDTRVSFHDFMNTTDSSRRSQLEQELDNDFSDAFQYLDKVEVTLQAQSAKDSYAALMSSLTEYQAAVNRYISQAKETGEGDAQALFEQCIAETDPLYDAVYQNMSDLTALKVETGKSSTERLQRFSLADMIAIAIIIVLAAVMAIVISIKVSRDIAIPVQECAQRLALLAEGDISAPVPTVKNEDETQILATSTKSIVEALQAIIRDESQILRNMAQGNFDVHSSCRDMYKGDFSHLLESLQMIAFGLNDTLNQISAATEQVDSSADQVSGGSQALSQGATEQASSVEELAATINGISQNVNDNAQNAEEASSRANNMGSLLNESNEQMTQMIKAMGDISSASNEIGKIIKTIEDIAFQTNILALNAAVEAARAGSAGKGFAVVADEVRNLASKSAEAANNTTVLIESAIRAVENGTKIANETAASVRQVVSDSEEVVGIIGDISKASTSQAESISQVTVGIDQIASVVQTNSATAEQSAAASQELSGQARLLNNLLSQFTFRTDRDSSSDGKAETAEPSHRPAPISSKPKSTAKPKPSKRTAPVSAPVREPAPVERMDYASGSSESFDISNQVGEIHFQDDLSKY